MPKKKLYKIAEHPQTVVKHSDLKKVKEDLRLVGKNATDLRKSFAGTLGIISRFETVVPELEVKVKELGTKVTKLFRDPIYTVPEGIGRKLEELSAKFNKHVTDVKARLMKVEKMMKEFEKLNATQVETVGHLVSAGEKLSARLDNIEAALEQVEGEVGSITVGENLTDDFKNIQSGAGVRTVPKVQMDLEEAINKTRDPSPAQQDKVASLMNDEPSGDPREDLGPPESEGTRLENHTKDLDTDGEEGED